MADFLQTSAMPRLALVTEGIDVSVVPRSVASLQREAVCYIKPGDPHLVSPTFFITRLLGESEYIRVILSLTYWLYDEQKIEHYPPQ
jgi:hypothetical protein